MMDKNIEDPIEQAWNDAHADLLILNEADRVKARTLVADFAGGDFNAADALIGLLHRNGFELVSATAMVATPAAAAALAARPAAPTEGRETCPQCAGTRCDDSGEDEDHDWPCDNPCRICGGHGDAAVREGLKSFRVPESWSAE